ncbi:MAG: hypothetical protein QXP66_00820 [Candidatus Aenigmatarchaeota archaeon]
MKIFNNESGSQIIIPELNNITLFDYISGQFNILYNYFNQNKPVCGKYSDYQYVISGLYTTTRFYNIGFQPSFVISIHYGSPQNSFVFFKTSNMPFNANFLLDPFSIRFRLSLFWTPSAIIFGVWASGIAVNDYYITTYQTSYFWAWR